MAQAVKSFFRRAVNTMIKARMRQVEFEISRLRKPDDGTPHSYFGKDLQRLSR